MTTQCRATKRNGEQCGGSAAPGSGWCWNHDPAHAEARRRNSSKGGKSSGRRDQQDLKRRISGLIDAVLDGTQDRAAAAVAIQGFNALRGALELERKAKETDELEHRLEELEAGPPSSAAWRKR